MQQGIFQSIPIKNGKATTVQQSGKFFKLIAVTPSPAPISVTMDGGSATQVDVGRGLPGDFKSLIISSTYNLEDVTALIYIGEVPLLDLSIAPEDNIFTTVDFFTLAVNGNVKFSGPITVNGVQFIRRKATFYNLTGTGFGLGNPATIGVIAVKFALFNAGTTSKGIGSSAGFGFNGPAIPLMPGTATQIGNPVTILGQDDITVNGSGATLDVSCIFEWKPLLTT